MNTLHPVMANALRAWMPMPTLAEIDEQRRLSQLREKLHDEYATGLDSPDEYEGDEE